MNATPCPQRQNMEQSQNTISKKCMQDHIHRRKMSTALLLMHICIHLRFRPENVVAQTPYSKPAGLYDPTKDKSILAVTHHLNRKQKSICNPTVASLNRRLLHTDAFAHRHFYTRKGCDGHLKIAILLSVFDVQRPFRAKGLRWTN